MTLHYITLHNTTLRSTTLHDTYYTTLRYTIPHYTTQHYTTLRCTTLHELHHTTTTTATALANTLITLHYSYSSTTLHYNYSYNCNYNYNHYTTLHPAVVVRRPLQPLQPFPKTQLQPPAGPSVDSLCHPWFTTPTSPIGFLFLKLPPPPCAALLALLTFNHS